MKQQKRGESKSGLRVFDIVFGCAALVLVAVGIWYSLGTGKADQQGCDDPGVVHQVAVRDDVFQPAQLTLNRCDTVKISNLGTQEYEFAFGEHDHHTTYPGFANMQSLEPNQYFELDAIKAGTYTLHDHLRDKAHLRLTIK